jgi:hypothetical protein
MKSVIQYLFKTFFQGLAISFIIACVLICIEIVFGRTLKIDRQFLTDIGYYCIYGVTLTLINSTYFDYLNTKVKWNKYARYRIPIGALGSVALTMVGVFFIRLLINVGIEGEEFSRFISNEAPRYYVVSLLITMVVSLFFHTVYFYKRSQENKVKEQKIIAGTASAQFETLKNQIDPHFLFNSLNVLSSLIEENPEAAQKFTTSLSKIYRYVLEQKDKQLVLVSEELSFAKTYMNLLKMRFENSLSFDLPEPMPESEAWVVPLSLQLLLENTVKHNVVSEQRPLHIRIFIAGDYLVIENVLQKKEVLQNRRGVGLQNIVSRYAIITNRKVEIEETPTTFTVKIPILTKRVATTETTMSSEKSAYLKAQKRMEDIKGFYGHLMSYIVVNLGLAVLNLVTYPQYWWFLYPAIFWGIGLGVHAMAVYNFVPFLGKDWEDKKIQEIIEKEKAKKWS